MNILIKNNLYHIRGIIQDLLSHFDTHRSQGRIFFVFLISVVATIDFVLVLILLDKL